MVTVECRATEWRVWSSVEDSGPWSVEGDRESLSMDWGVGAIATRRFRE
jgi:hypothetical protein